MSPRPSLPPDSQGRPGTIALPDDYLRPLRAARALLVEAQDPPEFANVMDAAEVARVYAERAHLGTGAINEATVIKLQAMAGLARAVDDGQAAGTIAKRGNQPKGNGRLSLNDIGIHSTLVSESRLVALADAEIGIEALAAERQSKGEEITRTEVVAIGRRIESGITEGQGDDWYTPGWLFDALGLRFDVDVCAPADPAHRTCPAARYLTEGDDGLAQPWGGLVWCNPPYSDAGPWAARMLDHGNGVLLTHIPANAAWAVDVWRRADAAVFLQAVEFSRPNGKTYRPGYALQLVGIGKTARDAVLDAAEITPKAGCAWERVP